MGNESQTKVKMKMNGAGLVAPRIRSRTNSCNRQRLGTYNVLYSIFKLLARGFGDGDGAQRAQMSTPVQTSINLCSAVTERRTVKSSRENATQPEHAYLSATYPGLCSSPFWGRVPLCTYGRVLSPSEGPRFALEAAKGWFGM